MGVNYHNMLIMKLQPFLTIKNSHQNFQKMISTVFIPVYLLS